MLPREINNDGPAAVRFLRDFRRARVGSVFVGVAGNLEPLNCYRALCKTIAPAQSIHAVKKPMAR